MTGQEGVILSIEEEDLFRDLDKFIQNKGWNIFYDFYKQLKEKYNPKIIKNVKEYSICPGVIALAEKTHLTHRERLALMMVLIPLGKEGDLIAIMKKQDNYKESMTMYQINNYKSKGKSKGITHVKLKEWGICKC